MVTEAEIISLQPYGPKMKESLSYPRHGYRVKDLVEQFDTKPAEIKALFSNSLDATRAAELRSQFLAAGLPI